MKENTCNYSDNWQPYIGDYDKFDYDIKTKDGKIHFSCYPNAGKFNPYLGEKVEGKDVVEIRFAHNPSWHINYGISDAKSKIILLDSFKGKYEEFFSKYIDGNEEFITYIESESNIQNEEELFAYYKGLSLLRLAKEKETAIPYLNPYADLTQAKIYSSQGKTSEEIQETRHNNIVDSIKNHMKKNGTSWEQEIELVKNKQSKLSKRERDYLLNLYEKHSHITNR